MQHEQHELHMQNLAGQRMDKALAAALPAFSRSYLQKLLQQGMVTLGGRAVQASYRVQATDVVLVTIPAPQALDVPAQNIPLDIRYEDADLLVVNKPRGMVVHPAPGHSEGTLVNALLHHCDGQLSGIGGVKRPGIVHRIDKDTSGLLLVAKTDFAHADLAQQIKAHTLLREYQAVVIGTPKQETGTIHAPIGRSEKDRKKMCVTQCGAREATTHYTVLTSYQGYSHLTLRLETGRTHQIRVHMAYVGHPVAGDMLYGPKKDTTGLGGQCLHAGTLGFVHPRSGDTITVAAELPAYFTQFLAKLTPK